MIQATLNAVGMTHGGTFTVSNLEDLLESSSFVLLSTPRNHAYLRSAQVPEKARCPSSTAGKLTSGTFNMSLTLSSLQYTATVSGARFGVSSHKRSSALRLCEDTPNLASAGWKHELLTI
ncbi:hypothetical protein R1sor_021522 [Riccia sorocarpa]|uniref:Uncharacterized protein n=1 Tax=Riccia sorocarpa TaxID=122646 RepID=A0ABD3GL15_9MARC